MGFMLKATNIMKAEELNRIIEKYDCDTIQVSGACPTGDLAQPWRRFDRAAHNQISGGEATLGRYAIWAETLRYNAHLAHRLIEEDRQEEALPALVSIINSLSACADVQREMDPILQREAGPTL